MEYGFPPFRNLIKRKIELPSINKNGAKAYLDSIKKVQKMFPDMIIIPGSETAAFYFWAGSYFKKNLTAHNHERRILTIGMEKPEDYVIASGESHSVKDFLKTAFNYVGLDYRKYFMVNEELYRPAEVNILQGDASKAHEKLKWKPTVTFEELVKEMVDSDLKLYSKQ